VDTEGLTFEVQMMDVEALNQKAFASTLDITKLSYHAFAYLNKDYVLLDAGSALGNNCGPLLISKQRMSNEQLTHATIAIPGKYTTANLLFSLAYPNVTKKQEMLFSDIEEAILTDKVEAGVIIHENRFTYAQKGLIKIRDLGEYWEETYHTPIPLGGIVAKRTLPQAVLHKLNRVLKRSVQYAWANPDETMLFVAEYAQEMQPEVMQQHIDLYVNPYTADLGVEGKKAIDTLFAVATEKQIIPVPVQSIFAA
jgi:1,4-dihydroxy-6-naphthoate synthase